MSEIPFTQYLVERLKQCGVRSVFGVPGDYNLELLDYIEKDDTLQWIGNANELNASYAADGYARVSGGLAVVVTTFGVGELSALWYVSFATSARRGNADRSSGIAGCLAERVPVLHIVGSPSSQMQVSFILPSWTISLSGQSSKSLLHHTLNLPSSFDTFSRMSEPLSCSQALLSKIPPATNSTWTDELDRVIKDVLQQCRPGYVEIPTDAVHHKVSSAGLKTKLVCLLPTAFTPWLA